MLLSLQTISVPFDDIESKSYAIVANYYQPDDLNVPVNVSVDVNGVMYTGYFDASYCPNTAGCNRYKICCPYSSALYQVFFY